jgi:hypothetical protein
MVLASLYCLCSVKVAYITVAFSIVGSPGVSQVQPLIGLVACWGDLSDFANIFLAQSRDPGGQRPATKQLNY